MQLTSTVTPRDVDNLTVVVSKALNITSQTGATDTLKANMFDTYPHLSNLLTKLEALKDSKNHTQYRQGTEADVSVLFSEFCETARRELDSAKSHPLN